MKNARLKLGYRKVKFENFETSGHEFHYSDIIDPFGLTSVARQYNIRGEEVAGRSRSSPESQPTELFRRRL